jgi:hypothetical protein
MTNGKKKRSLSAKLARAISPEGVSCFSDAPVLSEKDVADLKAVLTGERDEADRIDTKQAISLLAHTDRSPEASEILGRILGAESEPIRVRVSAAANLAVVGTEEAEAILLEHLDAGDTFVRLEVIESLGKVGTEASRARLEAVAKRASAPEARAAAAALVAIDFREGRTRQEGWPGVARRSVAVDLIEAEVIAKRVGNLWGSTYGIRLNPDVALGLPCGRTQLTVLLNAELKRGSWLEAARSRPLIAGIVTGKDGESERHVVRHVLLTRPTEEGFAIAATRASGDVVFAGEAVPDGDGYRLRVRDVGPERMPAEVEGVITNDSITLELHTWLAPTRRKRHGRAITG